MGRHRDRLEARRKELDLTQGDVAATLGISTRSYARYESGDAAPLLGKRRALASALGLTMPQLIAILDGEDIAVPNGHEVPAWLGVLASHEHGASEIRAFEPVAIHGLLQTEAYATAVERIWFDAAEAGQRVELRLRRQEVLRRSPDPLRLWVILDESTLLRPVSDDAVMADQLEHLANTAEAPNVTVQVMPLGLGAIPAAFGAFKLLWSPDWALPYMAVTEDGTGAHYLDREGEPGRHLLLFQGLVADALAPGESIDFIRRTAKERYR